MSLESVVKSNKNLRKFIEPFFWWPLAFGIDAVKFVRAFRGLPSVIKDYYIITRCKVIGGGVNLK